MVIEGVLGYLNLTSTRNNGGVVIDHHHFLHLLPDDTRGSLLISLQVTRFDKYALWSRSMNLCLQGNSKIGFVDGKHTNDKFDVSMHDQWEKVNVVLFSQLMNVVNKELLRSIIYSPNTHKVQLDLKERFDIINGSHVFHLHVKIVTLSQGTYIVFMKTIKSME